MGWASSPQICAPHSIQETKPRGGNRSKDVEQISPGWGLYLAFASGTFWNDSWALKRFHLRARGGYRIKVNSLRFQLHQRPSRIPFNWGPERNTLTTGWGYFRHHHRAFYGNVECVKDADLVKSIYSLMPTEHNVVLHSY